MFIFYYNYNVTNVIKIMLESKMQATTTPLTPLASIIVVTLPETTPLNQSAITVSQSVFAEQMGNTTTHIITGVKAVVVDGRVVPPSLTQKICEQIVSCCKDCPEYSLISLGVLLTAPQALISLSGMAIHKLQGWFQK